MLFGGEVSIMKLIVHSRPSGLAPCVGRKAINSYLGGIMINEYRVSESRILSQRLGMIIPIVMGSMSCIFGIILLGIFFLAPVGNIQLTTLTVIGILFSCIFFLFSGVLQFFLAFINYWIVKTVRIVTSPEGITFYSPGLEIRSSWNNIILIGKQKTFWGLQHYDSLVMKEPPIQKGDWWFTLLKKTPEKVIPLSMFDNWNETKLGQDIRNYASHLFS
jgi:hypothetical protein